MQTDAFPDVLDISNYSALTYKAQFNFNKPFPLQYEQFRIFASIDIAQNKMTPPSQYMCAGRGV